MKAFGAVLALLIAVPSFGGGFPPCVRRLKKGLQEPATLPALVRCQKRARSKHLSGLKGPASMEALDRLDDFQRAEVREYLLRHPDRASMEEPEKLPSRSEGGGDVLIPGFGGSREVPPGEKTQPAALNMERLVPEQAADFLQLRESLLRQSPGGAAGVTPAMAQDIIRYLNKQQGGVSVEMRDLLQAVEKDGVKLSHQTMLKLKRAARAAKSEGLNLGIDPSLEKDLLDPATDPTPEDLGGVGVPSPADMPGGSGPGTGLKIN